MIRPAVHADIETIAVLGRRFFDEAEWFDVAEWDHESILLTLSNMVDSSEAILLVADDNGIIGIAGGITFPLYFNHAHKSGQELFWWVSPDRRDGTGGKLLNALEDAARAAGCASWAMIALDKVAPERTGRIYHRRGYRASEHSYIKRL